MRAAVYYRREDVRIEELDEDEVGPGEVQVDVGFCGICGTDLHEYATAPSRYEPETASGNRRDAPGHAQTRAL